MGWEGLPKPPSEGSLILCLFPWEPLSQHPGDLGTLSPNQH